MVIVRPDRECPELEPLRGVADVVVVRSVEELGMELPGTEILFLNNVRCTWLKETGPGDLRWIHSSGTGVDALLTQEIVDSGVTVTISRGICEGAVAEWVLAVLLLMAKDLRTTIELQRQRRWVHRESEPLIGRSVALLGTGHVGKAIAAILRAVGLEVTPFGRTARVDESLGPICSLEELDDELPRMDDVVLALPLTSATRGIIGADRLARMRPGSRLVNVGRGQLVDEQALVAALERGHLGGAALDVFHDEPLHPEHPFWAMSNVLVSPHMSGDLVGWRDDVVRLLVENLARWRAGVPLEHVADLSAQLQAR